MKRVSVKLGERSYQIQVGRNLLRGLGQSYKDLGLGKRCALITDSKVRPLWAARVEQSLKKQGIDTVTITVPSGEKSKCLREVERCHNLLAQHRLERKSSIVALGGGVVGDLAGFLAATYLRGIPFVQIPTTLLAQVDSSVGGKTGVNLPAGKNLVGAFYQPRLVLCDLDTLNTLPHREFIAGLAEVIKYGIIYDSKLFNTIESDLENILKRKPASLETIIARSCAIKADVVSQDETESGLRQILNFGHTIGHGIEAIHSYGRYLHGEAISIGQVFAARLSSMLTGMKPSEVHRIESLFQRAGLPTHIRLTTSQRSRLQAAMKLDKKVSDGTIKFVLAQKIGKVVWGQNVPNSALNQVLESTRG